MFSGFLYGGMMLLVLAILLSYLIKPRRPAT
jgi:hypothetical protein